MDPGGSFSRHSVASRITQPVAITSVNPQTNPPQATGIMRTRESVQIDISHHVGVVQVTPAVGQQWIIIRDRGVWKLDRQLPFNTPDSLTPMVEGQTRIGSSGPTELNGSQININAPMRSLAAATEEIPDASTVPVGSLVYDTTLNQPLWSDGTNWNDAGGTSAISNFVRMVTGRAGTSITLAQLNEAVSDADVATLDGAETLTHKTLMSPIIDSAAEENPLLIRLNGTTIFSFDKDGNFISEESGCGFLYDENVLTTALSATGSLWITSGKGGSGSQDITIKPSGGGKIKLNSTAVEINNNKVGTFSITTQTTPSTLEGAPNHHYIILLAGSGAPTLPTAVGNSSLYTIKNTDNASLRTVYTSLSQTIEGSATFRLSGGASAAIVSDGTNWRVI